VGPVPKWICDHGPNRGWDLGDLVTRTYESWSLQRLGPVGPVPKWICDQLELLPTEVGTYGTWSRMDFGPVVAEVGICGTWFQVDLGLVRPGPKWIWDLWHMVRSPSVTCWIWDLWICNLWELVSSGFETCGSWSQVVLGRSQVDL
jgi:hypothetical protein